MTFVVCRLALGRSPAAAFRPLPTPPAGMTVTRILSFVPEPVTMAKARGDFTDILLRNGDLGPDQLDEAERLAASTGIKLQDALVKSNYATQAEVMAAIAEFHNLQFVDLTEVEIPKAVIELVPESVARENVVLPLSLEGNVLKIITSDPTNFDTIQKLQFILNKDIQPVLAAREQILEAINRHYGQTETESVDSMLAEFTDTADRLHRDRIDLAAWPRPTSRDAPVVKLVQPDHPGSGQPAGLATSTSSRSPTASASATGSTACWSSATARRAGCSRR